MARRIYHKMDYRITFGLIWALVLVASCSAYINEDMRGELNSAFQKCTVSVYKLNSFGRSVGRSTLFPILISTSIS